MEVVEEIKEEEGNTLLEKNLEEEKQIVEEEIDPELEVENDDQNEDPFLYHFERELPENILLELSSKIIYKTNKQYEWSNLGKFQYFSVKENETTADTKDNSKTMMFDLLSSDKSKSMVKIQAPQCNLNFQTMLKAQLFTTLQKVNKQILEKEDCQQPFTSFQNELLSILSVYSDLYFPNKDFDNEEAIRIIYCLHAANHILKTRGRILHHNAKISSKNDIPDSYRDQGFVRPKILILAPFKESALRIVKTLISLILSEDKGNVINKKRFSDEFSGETLFMPKTNPKPSDYMKTFAGNIDDNFKIGLSVTKKCIKLYTSFYSSDIIIASPLGLRIIIGAENEKGRDFDFLSSIEMVIIDQADVFLMQNWDHLLHIIKHLNLRPNSAHDTNFARIRPWAIDGHTRHFCQTIMFSSLWAPEHAALFAKYCKNFSGIVKVFNPASTGSICHITEHLPQIFHRFESDSLSVSSEDRFKYFTEKLLPSFKDKLHSHTLIFVSSYFDFVRLRNYFKREQVSFVQICEYTKDKKIARARDLFFHNAKHFMLYTERMHFFRRTRLKGIGHIIFYELPQYSHFYPELCNFLQEEFQSKFVKRRKNCSINVLYCKYDAPRLSRIVGTERCTRLIASDKKIHAFVSGEL